MEDVGSRLLNTERCTAARGLVVVLVLAVEGAVLSGTITVAMLDTLGLTRWRSVCWVLDRVWSCLVVGTSALASRAFFNTLMICRGRGVDGLAVLYCVVVVVSGVLNCGGECKDKVHSNYMSHTTNRIPCCSFPGPPWADPAPSRGASAPAQYWCAFWGLRLGVL